MIISKLEVAACSLPVPAPYRIGAAEITARDYVLLRLSAEDGVEGFGIGYAGGALAYEAISMLAPEILGRDSLARRALVSSLETQRVPARAAMQRALSLVDLALWDLACKRAELPLYRYLGELRRSVPCIAVAGFRRNATTRDESLCELRQLQEQGLQAVKVALDAQNPADSIAYAGAAARCMAGAGGTLAVDMQWAWRSLEPALRMCFELDSIGLRFIEDPFLPQQWRLAADLASRLKTPLACGEDIGDAYSHRELCEAVAISRVDATTCGGVTGALACFSVAEAFGRSVIPHVFPALHCQLACASAVVSEVEFIPESAQVDPINLLLRELPRHENGAMRPSDEPGIGIHPDWAAVQKYAGKFKSFDRANA